MSIKGICEDCGYEDTLLMLQPACSDTHLYNSMCCQKYICKEGCNIRCNICNTVNNVKSIDGFFFEEMCMACKTPLSFDFIWHGPDLKKSCSQYCKMGCFKNKQVMELKTEYNEEKYNIFLQEIEVFFESRFQPKYFNKLNFKTIEELNKSLGYPNYNTYLMLQEILKPTNQDLHIFNNISKEVISEIWEINID